MTTSATPQPAVRALFATLIDYAGLFPPAALGVPDAVREYRSAQRGPFAWMLGRFIVQAARVPQVLDALGESSPLALSLIVDGAPHGLAEAARLRGCEPRVDVQALEAAVPAQEVSAFTRARAAAQLSGVPTFVEWTRDAGWESAVPAVLQGLAAENMGAKVRCGGVEAAAVPTPLQLATFVYWACRYGVRFKATAGLHHPIRHFNAAAGFTMHGFLNLLGAVALARAGAHIGRLAEILACEDAAVFEFDQGGFRVGEHVASADEVAAMRREGLVAYGSCSFEEPIEDLRALTVL